MTRELLLWTLLTFLGAMAMLALRPAPLSNDSYQYLNAAEHIRHERLTQTSLVEYDTERSHGRIPAPLTSFPPGYPAMVAITGFRGDLEGTARLLSCLCYAGTAALLAWALMLTGVTAYFRQVVLLLFATNAVALSFATAALSEPLFMLLTTGSVAGLIWAEEGAEQKNAAAVRCVSACAAAALACWVRYAGFFMIAAVVGYALCRLLLPGRRLRAVFLLATLIPVTMAGAIMLRNLAAVGTWMGGNDMPVQNPLEDAVATYIKGHFHLILGDHAVAFGAWEILLLASGLGTAALVVNAVRKGGVSDPARQWKSGWRRPNAATLVVGICVLVYSAGIAYAGLRTANDVGTRMFLPILPLYLLLLGMGLKWVVSNWPAGVRIGWLKAGLLLAAAGYAGINARDLYERRPPAHLEVLAAQFAEETADGQPLVSWVDAHVPAGEVIVAADGQATGYLLHRPTLGMVRSEYSPVRWECDEVKKQMRRFKARYVFLYKPSSMTRPDPLLLESRFVATSISGQPPCGFVIAAENPHVRILRIGGAD